MREKPLHPDMHQHHGKNTNHVKSMHDGAAMASMLVLPKSTTGGMLTTKHAAHSAIKVKAGGSGIEPLRVSAPHKASNLMSPAKKTASKFSTSAASVISPAGARRGSRKLGGSELKSKVRPYGYK